MEKGMSAPCFRDWKYFDLIHGRQVHRDQLLKVRSKHLQTVANAFFNNIARTDSFSLFPAVVAAEALRDQLWRDYAIFKLTGKVSLRKRSYGEKTEAAINRQIIKLGKAAGRRFIKGNHAELHRRITSGVNQINEMLRHETGANQSMQNIMFAVVLESWTAFETLAADLWFTALDHGASEWRKRSGIKYDKPSESSEITDPSTIADPQREYGSFLRDTGKVPFQKLPNIITAYRTAFGKTVQEKLFGKDPYIFALSAVRNVITHKAGVADRKYVSAVKNVPELRTVVINTPIRLNGVIVRKLRNAAITVGNELVLFVDEQLSNQQN